MSFTRRHRRNIPTDVVSAWARYLVVASKRVNSSSRYRSIHVECKSKGIECIESWDSKEVRLINRLSVTINSNIRGTWVGKLWTRSIWSDQRRLGKSRYICVQPVVSGRPIDLSSVELSLQRAAIISDSTRASVTGETKVARDNDHLWIFHTLDGNISKINCEMKRSRWWNEISLVLSRRIEWRSMDKNCVFSGRKNFMNLVRQQCCVKIGT